MKLSNKKINIQNTHDFYKNLPNKYHNQFNIKLFLSIKINQYQLLIDPKDIYYVSQVYHIESIGFSKPYLLGYTRFNNDFYSILDLKQIIEYKYTKNHEKGILIFFNQFNNALKVNQLSLINQNDLKLIIGINNNPLKFISETVFTDKNGVFYYLLNSNKIDNLS